MELENLKKISYVIVGIIFILSFMNNLSLYDEPIFTIFGRSLWLIFGGIISVACGNKNVDISKRISGNENLSYIIGFIFGVFGLLGYWIYSKTKN